MRNLMVVARVLSMNAGMNVVFKEAQTASCNGQTVFIPNHWSYSEDPQAPQLLEGIMDHEALGHGRFTDFALLGIYHGKVKASQRVFAKTIHNILEDIYIEAKAMSVKPGVRVNLVKTVEILSQRGLLCNPLGLSKNGASLLITALLHIGRARLLSGQDQFLGAYADQCETLARREFGDALWDQIWNLAKQSVDASFTAQTIDLTKQIIRLIEDLANDEGDDQEGSSSNEGESPEDRADDQSDLSPPKARQDSQSSSSCQSGEGDDCDQQSLAKSLLESLSNDGEFPEVEITEIASQAMNEQAAANRVAMTHFEDEKSQTGVSNNVQMIANCVKGIADDLEDALVTQTKCQKHIAIAGRRIKPRVLSRVKVGNPAVFEKKQMGSAVNCAVSIVVDLSSSMSAKISDGRGLYTRRELALGSMFALADVLDEYEVTLSVSTYCHKYQVLKEFGAEWSTIRRKKVAGQHGGNTLTGAAVQECLGALACQPQERKLLIVITDGKTSDLSLLQSCYSEALYQGIEIASIMLGEPIEQINALASQFGFEAKTCDEIGSLGRYCLERILKAI